MMKINQQNIQLFLEQITIPQKKSHKGQNGKLLIIGGSNLFHAASQWSLSIASRFVDMVFYSSVPENNKLIRAAKQNFNDGIVVKRQDVEEYILQADCILIGPGMERLDQFSYADKPIYNKPKDQEWNQDTFKVANYLLSKYGNKKWVIDAGALQMIDPRLITNKCILTPHQQELKLLIKHLKKTKNFKSHNSLEINLKKISEALNQALILNKGVEDKITKGQKQIIVSGGNSGMTKGGTGDVLAGLVSALYCQNPIIASSVVASFINKAAADNLYQTVGIYFNASDLANKIPQVFWEYLKKTNQV